MPIDQIVFGVILPAAISGAILLVAWRSAPAYCDAAAGVAIALGYIAGHVLLMGWAFFPTEPWQWLFYLAVAAAVISVVDASVRPPAWLRYGLNCLLFALAIVLLLRPAPMNTWTFGESVAWIGGLWLGVMAFWISGDALAKRQSGSSFALLLVVVGCAASVVLLCSANAKLAQLAGVLTASVGATMVVSLFWPHATLAGGAIRVIAILLCGLLISGYFNDYSGLPVASFILIAAAPSFTWLAELGAFRRLKTWQQFSIRLLVASVPAAIGAAFAWRVY